MSDHTTNNSNEPLTPLQRIKADLRSVLGKWSLQNLSKNINFFAYLALLIVLYISTSHNAIEIQRDLNKQSKILKELHWQAIDVRTKFMNASTESEMIKSGDQYGLKPLQLPAFQVIVPHQNTTPKQ